MKSSNLKLFFTLICFIIFNSLFIQTNQYYNDKEKRLLFDSEESIAYLKDVFKDKLKIGSMAGFQYLNEDENFIKNHFDIIIPEYELFPEIILNQKNSIEIGNNTNPQVEFRSPKKKLFQFSEKNKIALHGHAFVWHSLTPSWLFKENFNISEKYVTKDIMDKRLENFIKNTFALFEKEFPNLIIYSYDIVTEIFLTDGGGLRKEQESNWVKIYGDDSFVIKAFTYARKYAPKGCKLLFSDFNEYIPEKTNDIYNIALKLKELGIIDGIGMQSHLSDNYPSLDDYKIAFEKFCSTGLEIFITELEIVSKDLDKQCNFYKNLFLLYLENKEYISGIIFYAVNDRWMWTTQINSGLFDYKNRPTKSYYCVIDAVDNKD